ncbi:MAG: hypothetical protein J0I26_07405 [Alphaproteobacteria bacterium]|nr:hypothetical protein [Alphaproteobacteria bacterium]
MMALVCGLLAAPAGAHASERAAPAQPVYRVDTVTIAPAPAGKLSVTASGAVRTGGWINPQLRPKDHQKERDTLVYDFVAVPPPPTAAVIQVLVPLQAGIVIPMPHSNITRIRIETETNSVISALTQPPPQAD